MIHLKGDTAAQLAIDNPVLGDRQVCYETDTLYSKLGDGVTAYNSLPYILNGGSPTGTAGGDLTGTYPNPTVAKLLGNAIPANAAGVLTNDGAGVLTWSPGGSGVPAGSNTQIQFNNSGAFGASANLVWDGNVVQVGGAGSGTGWGQVQSVITSTGSEAGLSLNNTSAGGLARNIISTGNASGIGGGMLSIGNATAGANYINLDGTGIITLGQGSAARLTINNNTGILDYYSNDPYFQLDGSARRFRMGDYTFDWYGTWIDIDDDAAARSIWLQATNGVSIGNLAGSGTQVISITNAGLLGYATDADITGKLLTGYVSGAGTVAATDSILQAINKLNGNIGALVTGVSSVNGATGVVVITVTGTTNRISVSGGTGITPTIDISASYIGQSSITTLGTITTGVWNGTVVGDSYIASALTGKSYNGMGITANTGTLHIANAKSFDVLHSITLDGTDGTTITFQGTDTYVGRTTTDTLTNKTLTASSNVLGGVTMTLGSDATGDIYYRSSGGILTRLANGGVNTVLHGSGTVPSYSAVVEGDISLTDLTTNNVTNTKHGFFPKLTANSVYYVDNSGALTALALGSSGTILTSNGATSAPTFTAPATSGTVTSVAQSFTGGLISVGGSPITSSGTLALTVAGTSGGGVYFSSTSAWASTALLAANAIMIGGGAGAAYATTTTGTGVLTALGVNVGSAGAFVTFNGALGTPSSGVGTNLTGTAAALNIGGSAASLSISGQTGLLTFTGLASTNRIKTVRDAADTILELGGSYTPTGTWTSLTMVTPVLGTPTSGTLTNCTGLPISSGVSGLGTGVATFLATPSSANLAAAVTDETGTGLLVFGTAPTFASTMTIGTASGTTGAINFKGTTSGTVTLSTADAAGTWTMKLPTTAGTNLYVLQTDGSGNTSWVAQSGGGGLTIGTTTITSGTNTRILYNNSGVVGEYTLTGTGTVVAMAAAPTFTGRTNLADGIFTTSVTTGTGATAGLQELHNNLTTGNGTEISSSSVTTGNVVKIISTSTAAASNTLTGLNIALSGANGTSSQTVYGQQTSVINTGTTNTNIAGYFTASGGTNNYGLIINAGFVGILNTAPTSQLHLNYNQNSVTQADANGILLANSTAAINGTQSISPPLILQGNGWATTGSVSRDVRFRMDVLPVQASVPTATWQLASSINAGAYTQTMNVTSGGNFFLNQSGLSVMNNPQIALAGLSSPAAQTYRTTNAGSNVTPYLYLTSAVASAGTHCIAIDNVTNDIVLSAGNGTRQIARAAIQLTNLTNTAASEAGDLIFLTQSGGTAMSQKMRISGLGNVVAGAESALSTSATDGFLYIPTCAGTPSGVPTSYTGKVAIVFDTTNVKLYIYTGGAWKGGTTPGVWV